MMALRPHTVACFPPYEEFNQINQIQKTPSHVDQAFKCAAISSPRDAFARIPSRTNLHFVSRLKSEYDPDRWQNSTKPVCQKISRRGIETVLNKRRNQVVRRVMSEQKLHPSFHPSESIRTPSWARLRTDMRDVLSREGDARADVRDKSKIKIPTLWLRERGWTVLSTPMREPEWRTMTKILRKY